MIRRKSRSTKRRGTRTCGYGTGKKHRGKGSRGGCGHAGIGKRGAQKKTWYQAQHIVPIGKHGFKNRRLLPPVISISIRNLEQNLDRWVSMKLAEKKGDVYTIDLSKAGYDKIISGGEVTNKLQVKCSKISASAKEEIEEAGGTVTLTEESEETSLPEEAK